jgi:hypothetical protein
MRRLLQSLAISAVFLASASSAHGQISFDLRFGRPLPPPRVYRVPPQPGPEYIWVEGYWYPSGARYRWHNGYWTLPPYEGAYWVAPYYDGGEYFAGHWEGGRGNVFHNHRWDRSRRRDERREPNRYDRRRRE